MSHCENVGDEGTEMPVVPVVLSVLSPLASMRLHAALQNMTGVVLEVHEGGGNSLEISFTGNPEGVIEKVKKALENLDCRMMD